jgi:hypothetical protein
MGGKGHAAEFGGQRPQDRAARSLPYLCGIYAGLAGNPALTAATW